MTTTSTRSGKISSSILRWVFVGILTAIIALYAGSFAFLTREERTKMHEDVPVLGYVGSVLGTYSPSTGATSLFAQPLRARPTLGDQQDERLKLRDPQPVERLYSPHFAFAGTVDPSITSLSVTLYNTGGSGRVTKKVQIYDGNREFEASLQDSTLLQGENYYTFTAITEEEEEITTTVLKTVDYQRIELGGSVLYLDPIISVEQYGRRGPIAWTTEDLNQDPVQFITRGCDTAQAQQPILIERTGQYETIPACLSFSTLHDTLIWFEFIGSGEGSHYYDVHHSDWGVVRESFALFSTYLGDTFQSLLFRNPLFNAFDVLSAQGGEQQFILTIERRRYPDNALLLRMDVTDGTQVKIENEKEKILMYMYKEGAKTTELRFPGNRYEFFVKTLGGRWKRVNSGPLYTLPISIYGTRKDYLPTFSYVTSFDGTMVRVDDGIKTTSFDYSNIGETIEVEDTPLDKECVPSLQVHDTLIGDPYQTLRLLNRPYLVGQGWFGHSITITHNELGTVTEPGQWFAGYLSLRLSQEKKILQPGINTFTVAVKNPLGIVQCEQTLQIEVF